MFFRILHLLLAADVILCPLACQLNRSVHVSADKKPCCCCEHACAPQDDMAVVPGKSRPIHGQTPAEPCKCCTTCLCGGGIVAETTRLAIDNSFVPLDLPAMAPLGLLSEGASYHRAAQVADRSDGENVGRRMRCLLNSLLV